MIVGVQNGHEKIKIDEEAVSEILVADADLESNTEARGEGGGQQASADDKAQLQQVAEDYQPGDCLKEGKKNIHLEDLGRDRIIILKWLLKEQDGWAWIGLIWIRIKTRGGFF
jgi:hypothetical protein